jgi:hypothetical protein
MQSARPKKLETGSDPKAPRGDINDGSCHSFRSEEKAGLTTELTR